MFEKTFEKTISVDKTIQLGDGGGVPEAGDGGDRQGAGQRRRSRRRGARRRHRRGLARQDGGGGQGARHRARPGAGRGVRQVRAEDRDRAGGAAGDRHHRDQERRRRRRPDEASPTKTAARASSGAAADDLEAAGRLALDEVGAGTALASSGSARPSTAAPQTTQASVPSTRLEQEPALRAAPQDASSLARRSSSFALHLPRVDLVATQAGAGSCADRRRPGAPPPTR